MEVDVGNTHTHGSTCTYQQEKKTLANVIVLKQCSSQDHSLLSNRPSTQQRNYGLSGMSNAEASANVTSVQGEVSGRSVSPRGTNHFRRHRAPLPAAAPRTMGVRRKWRKNVSRPPPSSELISLPTCALLPMTNTTFLFFQHCMKFIPPLSASHLQQSMVRLVRVATATTQVKQGNSCSQPANRVTVQRRGEIDKGFDIRFDMGSQLTTTSTTDSSRGYHQGVTP